MNILVLAKEPLPGRVKTRLCPPCSPEQAATVARAALADTLRAVAAVDVRVSRRILVLDGRPGSWLPNCVEVIPQRGVGLTERLAAAFEDAGGPGLLVGMDTPQVTPALLQRGLDRLRVPGTDAVLAPASDGGWWSIGLLEPDPRVFLGVPMSTGRTFDAQLARLSSLRLRVRALPLLRDVDRMEDALAVSSLVPRSRFARAVAEVEMDPATLAYLPSPVPSLPSAGEPTP